MNICLTILTFGLLNYIQTIYSLVGVWKFISIETTFHSEVFHVSFWLSPRKYKITKIWLSPRKYKMTKFICSKIFIASSQSLFVICKNASSSSLTNRKYMYVNYFVEVFWNCLYQLKFPSLRHRWP